LVDKQTIHQYLQPPSSAPPGPIIFWPSVAGINIQSTSHDSIEDARTALKLYHKYKELIAEGKEVQAAIKEMYEKGRALQWKIPEEDTDQSQGSVAKKDII